MEERLKQREKLRRKKKAVKSGELESVEIKKEIYEDRVEERVQEKEEAFVDIELVEEELKEEIPHLDTTFEEIPKKTTIIKEFVDIELIDEEIEKIKMIALDTTLIEIKKKRSKYEFVDIELSEEATYNVEIPYLDTSLEEIRVRRKNYDFVDIELIEEEQEEKEETFEIDTSFEFEVEDLLIQASYLIGGRKMEEPILEKYINSSKKWFPRGLSETLNEPIIVLIGEDEKDWHIPILYVLRESMREILEHFPKVIFRKTEDVEENIELLDSTDLNSLENFTLENSIEFLDLRKDGYAMDDIFKRLQNRLQAGFLQRFGVFVVTLKRKDLMKAYKYLQKVVGENLKIYVVDPEGKNWIDKIGKLSLTPLSAEDTKKLYTQLIYTITGISGCNTLFEANRKYEKIIEEAVKNYSVFVKRQVGKDSEDIDRFQYPIKVAVFYYLLNKELQKRKYERKVKIDVVEEIIEIIKNDIISTEKMLENENGRKIYPDIVYNSTAIEIETLIGTVEPMKKIDESIDKYDKYKGEIDEVWIVLRPVSAILHYEELKKREKIYKEIYERLRVKIKVITLVPAKGGKLTWDLTDINEFLDPEIKNLPDKLRAVRGDKNE